MSTQTAVVWFRQDLRINDNPAFLHALTHGYRIVPIYILDDDNAAQWKMGGASRWWLHQSLQSLNNSLCDKLLFAYGPAETIIPSLCAATQADAVFWNRCYEPWRLKRDKTIKSTLKSENITVESFNGSLLWEPWEISKNDGTPYKVFTPYYKNGCLKTPPEEPENSPHFALSNFWDGDISGSFTCSLEQLSLMPDISWYKKMAEFWTPGEQGAQQRLHTFLEDGLHHYKELRNRPDMDHVSYLSPHLHFGEISPREAWHTARTCAHIESIPTQDIDCFCSELAWREFSYYLLYHFPQITWDNLQTKFDVFPWITQESEDLKRWQTGQTGIPIVDAGMRQLWQTGWMHNRVRMIVASLLVKNLLIHWHCGEEWFWDTLVDADLASNAASWQWVAGSGADAAPYFRIFNPVTQGEKFDPNGTYIRQYVPELANMPNRYIHHPWDASPETLKKADIILGKSYPYPIVDLKESRERALKAFETTKQST